MPMYRYALKNLEQVKIGEYGFSRNKGVYSFKRIDDISNKLISAQPTQQPNQEEILMETDPSVKVNLLLRNLSNNMAKEIIICNFGI